LSLHERSHLQAFTDLLALESIECSFQTKGSWEALMSTEEVERVAKSYEMMRDAEGEEGVRELRFVRDPEEAEKVTRIKGAQGAMRIPAGQMWVSIFLSPSVCLILHLTGSQ
jgi:uncharacterized protein (DUF1697 family)